MNYLIDKVEKLKPSGIRKFFDMAKGIENLVALSVGEPDFDTPWHISEAGVYAITTGKTYYSPNNGLLELREEISKWNKRKYGLDYSVNEIVVTIGGSEAIDLIFRATLQKGDGIILTNPGYVSYEPCAKLCDAEITYYNLVEEDEFKIKADKLEKLIKPNTKILMINYPNNPTGAIMGKEDLLEISKVCIKHNILVVSDEIYSELTYGKKHVSIGSIEGMKDRCVIINGFSKSYSMTGWRLGYILCPQSIISGVYKIHQFGIMCAPTISQYAGIEALRNGDNDIYLMKKEYESRRNYLIKRFQELNLDTFSPRGAFYFFVNIKKFNKTSEEFALDLLNKEKLIVIPGSAFGSGGEGFIRISYAYSQELLIEATKRLEKYIKENY